MAKPSFGAQVKAFRDKAINDRVPEFMSRMTVKVAEMAIANTPVRTGLLRGSWTIGINTIPVVIGMPDPGGDRTIENIIAKLKGALKATDKINLVNTAPYAQHIEFGTAAQPGYAMLRMAVARAPEFVGEILEEMGVR